MLHKEKVLQLARMAENEDSRIVTAWDLREWSEADIEQSEQEKYLISQGYADTIRCNRCHKGCTIEPTMVQYPDGQKKGVFHCSDEDEGGRIEFDMREMRYWEINIKQLGIEHFNKKEIAKEIIDKKIITDEIPPDHRTYEMSKTELAALFGTETTQKDITRMICAGALHAIEISRQKFIFDKRDLPKRVLDKL